MKREKFFSLHFLLIKKRLKRFFLLLKLKKSARQIVNKKQFHTATAAILLIVILVNVFLPEPGQIAQAATYTFVQTSWSGGASATVISHPTNQTGWTNFSTSTNTFTTGTSTVTIASTTYSSTDDGTFSSTGGGTGGGFSNGTTSSVAVSGSGASAVIKLSGSTSALDRVTVTSSNSGGGTPGFHGGAQVVGGSGSDYLYFVEARNQNDLLRRYSISGNSWTDLAEYTFAYFGAQLLWNGSDNYIYLARGQGTGFDRYSISGNSWSSMAAIPAALPTGITQTAALRYGTEDYIYLFRGAGQTAFYRYSISGNSWSTMTALPVTADVGIQAVRDADGDYIYVVTGNSTAFYRYSISGNSWSHMASSSVSLTGNNASVLHDDGSDYIYLLTNNSFLRYSISGNSWSTMADASSVNPDYGSTLVHPSGGDVIYATGEWDCCGAVRVWRYSISGNSWTGYHTTAAHSGGYGAPNKTAYLRSGDESFYFFTANQDNELFKYTMTETIYNTTGTFISAAMDLGVAEMKNLSWTSTTPSGIGNDAIRFQLAANNDNSTWSYVGPDGTTATYFINNGSTSFPSSFLNKRYWRYKAYLGTSSTSATPSLDNVTFSYSSYATSSSLTSSMYDAGDPTNVLASVAWNRVEPTSTTIKFQLRTGSSTSSLSTADFVGPSGVSTTYFTTNTGENTSSTMRDGSADRYFQYKVYLETTNRAFTPTLIGVTTTYVVNASPEIQNASSSQMASGTVSITYQVRDSDTDTGTVNPGYVSSTFEYLDAAGAYQSIPSSQLSSGANTVAVDDVNWTTSSVTWTPPTGLSVAASRIRVTLNDNEAANNTTSTISNTFQLDTVTPASGAIVVDGSQTPALVTLTAVDSSTLYMKVSLNSTLSDVSSWSTFNSTTTITLTSNPATVYVQFKDGFNNTSSIFSATTPETPSSTIVQDISNVVNGTTDYRLFVAWKVITTPSPGFANYIVFRSLDQSTWTAVATNTTIANNYIADSTVNSNTLYYYKVKSTDSSGNVSIFSSIVNGRANGDQDAGEGGGGAGPPIITSVATSSPTPSSVTITWNTDVLSNSIVGFSTTAGNFTDNSVTVGTMVDSSSGSIGPHTVVLGGLTPNTTYYFNVKSVTAASASTTENNGGNGYIFRTPNGSTITGVSASEVYNTSARIVWNTSENADSTVYYSTSTNLSNAISTSSSALGTSHDITLTGLTGGTRYYFYVQSVNASQVTSTDKNLVNGVYEYYNLATTLDTTAPTISSIATTTSNNSSNVTWVTNEIADSQIIYGTSTNYGSTTTLDSTYTTQHLVTVSGLASSTLYHFKILSRDKNNNLTSSTDQVITTTAAPDATAPTITSVATSSVTLTGVTITWSTNENASSIVEYGLTASAYNNIAGSNTTSITSHSVSLTGLSGNTTYYFRVRSTDSSGNAGLDDNSGNGWRFVTVADTTAPTISNVTILVNNTSSIITWITNEAATSEINYDTTSGVYGATVSSSTLNTGHSITLTGLTANTTYYFRIRSADASSNTSTDNNGGTGYSFTTLAAPVTIIGGGGSGAFVDRDPPSIVNLSITDITPISASVSWSTNEEGNSLIRYGSTVQYGILVGNDEQLLSSQHNVKLFNLKPGQTYHLKAVTYDAAGNRSESQDQIFTTLNADGTQATSTATTTTTATSTEDSELPPETQFISESLQKASSRSLQQFLKDIASNPLLKDIPEDKFIQALLEMASKVIDAPTIVGIKPTVEVKGTTAIITWSTDKKSTSEVNFAKDGDYKPADRSPYTNAAVNPDEFGLAHRVELTGLDPGILYHFKVVSRGLIGPEASSADFTFRTSGELPAISDIRVTRPTNTQSMVVVGWKTNVPTAGTVEYKNARSGQSLTQGDASLLINHEVTLKSLEGGINYTLVIKAKDEFNNEVSSLPITFSTSLDKAQPTISKLSSDSTLYPGRDSKVQTIISWETDEPATSQVFYQEGLSGDNIISLPLDTALNTRHIVVVTKFKPGTVYKYWVESKDLAGNMAKSEVFSILTPQEKETIIDIIINNFQSVFGWTKNIGI